MARPSYSSDLYRMPKTSIFIIILVLVNHWEMFPAAQCSWLFFGKFQGLQNAIGPRICDEMSLVPKQKAICLDDPKVMASVGEGAFKGIGECQHQFRNEKWNCSINEKGQAVFGKVINRGSREAAFVHAIAAAGVMYFVTRACSRGDINSCSCDRRKHGKEFDLQGEFTWGGCSDDIINGTYFVREFVDANEIDVEDARAGMNLHNNNAGRRAVKKFVRRQCKCHGHTGSCHFRTCWESLGDFRRTGDYLKDRYDDAVHVTVTQNGPKGDLVSAETSALPSKNDLVFLEDSPDYCLQNSQIGTYGTAGRECNATSSGKDGCETLCCGRGYTTTRVKRTENCMCQFHWCCEIRCQECKQIVEVHTCRGEEDVLDTPLPTADTTIPTTQLLPASTTEKRRRKGKRRNKKRGRGKGKGKRKDRQRSKKRTKREIQNPSGRSGEFVSPFRNRRKVIRYETAVID